VKTASNGSRRSATNAELPEKEATVGEQSKRKKEKKKPQRPRTFRKRALARTKRAYFLLTSAVSFFGSGLLSSLRINSGAVILSTSAFIFAVLTLVIYIPTQLSTEGSLTILSTEVKCILALTLVALVTVPIAKDPPTAWVTFNDSFIKAVLMFIVMVNVLRTRRRLIGLLWLSLSVGVYLSYTALDMYLKGEMKVEGYRVGVEVKGLFGNPNDLALHLVMMTPIALALALGSRGKLMRLLYFSMTALFVAANTITFSRGGFLGLLASAAILVWKLSRKNRLNISIVSIVIGGLFILLAPGNYGCECFRFLFLVSIRSVQATSAASY
jgi:hypothetical protein